MKLTSRIGRQSRKLTARAALTFFGAVVLLLLAAPAWADQCSAPSVGTGAGSVGSDTGGLCSVLITVTAVNSSGSAIAFDVTTTGTPAFDGTDDILVGVENNSGGALNSITLSSPDTSDGGVFGFDGDGPCSFNGSDCFLTPTTRTGYEGPVNTFTNINSVSCPTFTTCHTTGTVSFTTAIADGGSTWFALEGAPQSISLSSQTVSHPLNANTTDFDFTTPGSITRQTIDYSNSGTNPTNTNSTMQVTLRAISDSQFANLVANTFAQGSQCLKQDLGNGNFSCAVTIALCIDPTHTTPAGTNCPQANNVATSVIGVKEKFTAPPPFFLPQDVPHPGYLAATDNALNCDGTTDTNNTCRGLHNIFTDIQNDCCATSGTTKNFNSLFVPVSNLTGYNFTGFFQPVDNPPVYNVAKAGSAIPVKFSIGGNFGLNILQYSTSQQIVCTTNSALEDTIETTINAGSSSLSYDATSNQYSYVWKTQTAWAGTCRQLVVTLADGTTHNAYFMFKK